MSRWFFYFGRGIRETGRSLDHVGSRLQGRFAYKSNLPSRRNAISLYELVPKISNTVFVAPNASIIGKTHIGANSAIWYAVIINGDENEVNIGENVSIGDSVVINSVKEGFLHSGLKANIGNNVTVGASSHVCGATVEDGASVGVGCSLLEGSVVGTEAILGSGSTLLPGTRVPPRQYWTGSPAQYVRDITEQDLEESKKFLQNIIELAQTHQQIRKERESL